MSSNLLRNVLTDWAMSLQTVGNTLFLICVLVICQHAIAFKQGRALSSRLTTYHRPYVPAFQGAYISTGECKTGKLFALPGVVNEKLELKRNGVISMLNKAWAEFRRVIVACLLSLQMLTGKVTQKMAQTAIVMASVGTMLPAPASANIFRKYAKLSPAQKLATTPLFFVSNSGGAPYLQEDVQSGNPNQRIVVYFMSSEDANEYLNEMAQGSPGNINEFRITAVSMEKIVNKIQARKQSRKLGRFPMQNIYRIQPSSRQCNNAEKIVSSTLKSGQSIADALEDVSIPMFAARGLVVRRGNGEAVTPYYFAYEDLKQDWDSLIAKGVSVPTNPPVEVCDFAEVMCLSKGITEDSVQVPSGEAALQEGAKDSDNNAEQQATSRGMTTEQIRRALASVGVVPPRREIEMIRKYYRNEGGLKNEFSKAKILKAPR